VNTVIETHDSRVVEISESNGVVVLHLKPAYLHKSEGCPAIDAGTGWLQEAKLIFSEAAISGEFPDWPCDLMDGEILIQGVQYNNLIPVPLEISGAIELRLVCDAIHQIKIAGSGVQLNLIGEPKFVKELKLRGSSL
jgi:hypothetical protein